MPTPGYLSQSLRRPLPTKDGGILRTVADAADYMMALSKDRQRAHWQRAARLILGAADADDLSRQVELALFYDRQLDLRSSRLERAMFGTGVNLDGYVRQARQSFKPGLVSGHGLRPIGDNRGNQRSMSRSNTPKVQVAHPVAMHLKPLQDERREFWIRNH